MQPYVVAIAVVVGLSTFSLASWVNTRLNARWNLDFFVVYDVVLAIAAACGLLAFGVSAVLGSSLTAAALAIPVGVAVGIVAIAADRVIVRTLDRPRYLTRRSASASMAAGSARASLDPTARLRVTPRPGIGAHGGRVRRPDSFHVDLTSLRWRLLPLVGAAVLEELIFRGTLVQGSLLMPTTGLRVLTCAGVLAAFALSHIQYGWSQVWAKLPLGSLALASVLVMETVLAAVIAHVVFNTKAWADIRRLPAHQVTNG
jgi:Type II CAAX prenyl endopeptidase Rce1-like